MKLSNKILLGFFGVIFIYMTAAFVEVRVTGTLNVLDEKNSIAETADITGIAYVVLDEVGERITISGSGQAQLEVRSRSGEMLKALTWTMSGDTLTISGMKSDVKDPIKISVFIPEGLKGISVNSSDAVVRGLKQDQLHISENSGSVSVFDSRISRVNMDLSNRSRLDIFESSLDTVATTIDASQASIYSSVEVLQGTMKRNSYLHLNGTREIQLRKDESSRLNFSF